MTSQRKAPKSPPAISKVTAVISSTHGHEIKKDGGEFIKRKEPFLLLSY